MIRSKTPGVEIIRKNMKNIYLSIVIPCYNEEENLKREVLKEVWDFLIKQKYTWEVVVSDDGSTDNSRGMIRKQISNWNNFKLLENTHKGKPSALWSGIKKAKGKYVLLTDMDQSTPIEELKKLLTQVDNFNVVIGSRGLQRKDFPIYRKLGALVFMSFRKLMILSEINDTQCGFKLFKTDLLKAAFPKLEYFKNSEEVVGWKVTSYDVELLHILKKMKVKIKEVKVIWDDRDKSASKGGVMQRYFRESIDMLKQIIIVKKNDLKGLYD